MGDFLKKGYLLKCPQNSMNPFKKWKSRWFVLYGNSTRGRVRLEYYDSEKSWQQEKGKRCIALPHCVSIKPVWNKDYNHVIEIVTQDKTYYLAAGSKDDEKVWFRNLCKAVFGSPNRNSIVHVVDRARPDPIDLGYHSLDRSIGEASTQSESSEATSQGSPASVRRRSGSGDQLSTLSRSREQVNSQSIRGSNEDIDEGGASGISRPCPSQSISSELSSLVSFESGFDDTCSLASSVMEGTFSYPVTVRSTIASQKAGLNGTYILQISPHTLHLIDIPTQNVVADWPIQFLRRYGRGRTKFSFEANEKCKLGKGVYTFNTLEGDSIFHQVDMYARKISSLQKLDSKEKRVSLPEEGFRPLQASTKKWHHSDGKLSEIANIVPLAREELDNSLNDVTVTNAGQPANFLGRGHLPSKSRTPSGLEVISDNEHKKVEEGGQEESQERRNSLLAVESAKTPSVDQPTPKLGESTENLLANPALIDDILPIKSHEQLVSSIKETVQDIQEFTSNTQGRVNQTTADDDVFCHDAENKHRDSNKISDGGRLTNGHHGDVTSLKPLKVDIEVDEHMDAHLPDTTNKVEKTAVEQPRRKMDSLSVLDKLDDLEGLEAELEEDGKEMDPSEEREVAKSRLERMFERTFGPRKKTRRVPLRQKSFELPNRNEVKQNHKMSGSFSTFDHTGQPVEMKGRNVDGEPRRLHRRYLSVLKRIEMFEQLEKSAEECRKNSYTVWRRKSVR